jgi:serine/threonine protein kinase
MPLTPGQVIRGRYHIVALRSQGGMGAVYEAKDTILDVDCALKEMVPYPGTMGTALPDLREQFRQEAQVLAELRHPNLPRVTDHFEEDGNAYLVMDLVRGRRLDDVVAQEGKLSEEQVLAWARQLMGALAHCHAHRVIHRDVKPQNVIITEDNRAILVDFGLAKLVDPSNPRTRTVMRGLGTPEYAPPEQYDMKQGRTDARTDVYSLSATLYHALAGEPPPMLSERVINPESLSPVRQHRDDITRITDWAIMKALNLKPIQRFQSIAEMHKALLGESLPEKTESVVHTTGEPNAAYPSQATAILSVRGLRRLQTRYPIPTVIAVVALLSLITVITSWAAGVLGPGSVSTATPTPTTTATTSATLSPTTTSLPTETPTAAPTASPTPEPTMPLPTNTIAVPAIDLSPRPSTPTPTATPRPILPTRTSTPALQPTNTLRPRGQRPATSTPTQPPLISSPTEPAPAGPTPMPAPTDPG